MDLVASFMDDAELQLQHETPAPTELQLQHDGLSDKAKRSLIKRAYAEAANLYETLREIHDSEAWKIDGKHTSFKDWYTTFAKNVEHVMNYSTFYRKLAYDRARVILIDAGADLTGLTQQTAYPLLQDIPEALVPEAWAKAQQNAKAHQWIGKSKDHAWEGKVLPTHVEDAKLRVMKRIEADLLSDPFNDSPTNVEPLTPIFDATADGRFVPDPDAYVDGRPDFFSQPRTPSVSRPTMPTAKPPEPVYTMPNTEQPSEIALAYDGMEEAAFEDVCYIYGTDGVTRFAIPVRIAEIERWRQERGE